MCGIAGFVDFTSNVDPNAIKKMTDSISYRGPDSAGKFVSKDKTAVLGIRRLSIIDLKTGDQPIKNEDGNITVVYNGEIYNYKKLRIELQRNGHKFKTKTDTEVLVHGYEEWGEEVAKYINGMFAFAIWDEKEQKLFITRDRAGIKPLYWSFHNGIFIFGSEPKTILNHPKFNKDLNIQGLNSYLYFGYLPGTVSMYKNISKLLPGHSLTFSNSGLKINKFWEMNFNKDTGSDLDKILERAVNGQLIADVPVGVFLSGGLDSSLISYYITKNRRKMKSFSISFQQKSYDESEFSYAVAKKLGTEHYVDELRESEVPGIFKEISFKLDEPLADASLIPTYKVSKLARRYVTVALSGDGGDELFGGYPTHQAHIIADRLKFFPQLFLDFGIDILSLLPTSFENYPVKHLGTTFLEGVKKDPIERQVYWMRTFFLTSRFLVGKPDLREIKRMMPKYKNLESVKLAQITDFFTYLRDDFFVKTDRASMFNSLEVRVPYLDNYILDFAFSQSSKKHLSIFETKKMLRNLARKYLPKEVANRPKKGFGIPTGKWLREGLKDFGIEMLENKKLYDFVNRKSVLTLWNNHQEMKENNSGALWQLIVLSGWINNFL